jgi:hypothetical protein
LVAAGHRIPTRPKPPARRAPRHRAEDQLAMLTGDGKPITLKFADAVGEVLTVGPVAVELPLPFMYYI